VEQYNNYFSTRYSWAIGLALVFCCCFGWARVTNAATFSDKADPSIGYLGQCNSNCTSHPPGAQFVYTADVDRCVKSVTMNIERYYVSGSGGDIKLIASTSTQPLWTITDSTTTTWNGVQESSSNDLSTAPAHYYGSAAGDTYTLENDVLTYQPMTFTFSPCIQLPANDSVKFYAYISGGINQKVAFYKAGVTDTTNVMAAFADYGSPNKLTWGFSGNIDAPVATYEPWTSFNTSTTNVWNDPNYSEPVTSTFGFADQDFGAFGNMLVKIAQFLFIFPSTILTWGMQSLLQAGNRAPLGYFTVYGGAILGAVQAAEAIPPPTLTVHFMDQNYTFISADSISQAGINMDDLKANIFTPLLWLGFMVYILHRSIDFWHTLFK